MNKNPDNNAENEITPSVIWIQLMDYLITKGKQMKTEYAKRMRDNKPFSINDLNDESKHINNDLNYLMTYKKIINDNNIKYPDYYK